MGSFNLVTAGNQTLATDINQYANILNGSVGATVTLVSPNNTTSPLFTYLPSAPASDLSLHVGAVTGDTTARTSAYIRGADGYGGFRAGVGGAAVTAHWYATSTGWKTDESVIVNTNLNVNGSATVASLTVNGGATVNGALTLANIVNGILQTNNVAWVNQQTQFGGALPSISLAIGDNDTGIAWVGDGQLQLRSNGGTVLAFSAGQYVPKTNTSGQTLYAGTGTPSGNEGDVWFKA